MNSDSVQTHEFYYHNLKRKKEFHNPSSGEEDLFYRRLSDQLSELSASSGVDVDLDSSCDGDASGEEERTPPPSPVATSSPVIKTFSFFEIYKIVLKIEVQKKYADIHLYNF
jgi:hypothetical protein